MEVAKKSTTLADTRYQILVMETQKMRAKLRQGELVLSVERRHYTGNTSYTVLMQCNIVGESPRYIHW